MSNIPLLWRTIKHLKRKQISNRLVRTIKNYLTVSANYNIQDAAPGIKFQSFPKTKNSYSKDTFTFLNKEKSFTNGMDWNFDEYGKLWTYHLNYLECLIQKNIDPREAKKLLHNYIEQTDQLIDGCEPYPTSLRLIHVIKFLSEEKIRDIKIDTWIGRQAILLQSNLEYHLMGNHLLENGFALLFSSFHLRDVSLYRTAVDLLLKELNEQILEDGAHFELSPMYHMIVFSRILDSINLVSSNDSFDDSLLKTLKDKAVMMLSWLENMMVKGMLPRVNDSYDFDVKEIQATINYANEFGIFRQDIPLGESGYRLIRKTDYTLLFDIGNIGPDYIPGHAHADSLQFLLWIRNKEIITETGVSTYERNDIRQSERSTTAHNTVTVNDVDSSEVWAAFRVGARAKIFGVKEGKQCLEASHNGYEYVNVTHNRKIEHTDKEILITDTIKSSQKHQLKSYLHFHPEIEAVLKEDRIWLEDCIISFLDYDEVELSSYQYASSYGKTVPAIRAIISFDKVLITKIEIL